MVASLLGTGSIRLAHAQTRTPTFELQYDAPTECPTRSAVEQAALRLAGQPPRTPVAASVYIEHEGTGYRAHVKTHAGARQRVLADASCTAVAEAIEVLLALTIDPEAHIAGVTPAPSSSPAATATSTRELARRGAQQESVSTAVSRTKPVAYARVTSIDGEPTRGRSVFISALLGVEGGALPHVAELGTIGLALPISSHLRLAESGRFWRHSGQTLEGTPAGGVFSLWTFASSVCFTTTRNVPVTRLCLGLEAGRLSGASYGVRENGSGGSLWLAPLAGFEASVPTGTWISLVVGAELGVPLVRRGFYLQEIGAEQSREIHQPSALSARGSFGLSANL